MSAGEKIGLFPGTFDPITNGHMDVIHRGQGLFDRLIVAIGRNPGKRELFSQEERRGMIEELLRAECQAHVEVAVYQGLTVDFARVRGVTAILRGLRNVTDLNHEFRLALTNRAIAEVETCFVMAGQSQGFTSSTLIKQIAAGGELDRLRPLLPGRVVDRLKQKKEANGGRVPWATVDELKE